MKHTEQLRDELIAVIERYSKESDLTVWETIAVLEVLKLEHFARWNSGTQYSTKED